MKKNTFLTCKNQKMQDIKKCSRDIAQPGLARLSGGQKVGSSNLPIPTIFFAKKWSTKTQVFTSLREAQLHSKGAAFSSHLHQTPEALLVKSFHSAYASFYL